MGACGMQINIRFLSNIAPETVAAVHALAANVSACQSCRFYCNEAVPPEGTLGPPYGLLQVISPIVTEFRACKALGAAPHACILPPVHMLMHISTSGYAVTGRR